MARPGFRKPHVSMRGTVIDMDAMRAAGEGSVAVGNAKMNARGDILGRKGQIEVRREAIAAQYAAQNPQGTTAVSLKPALPDTFETPAQAMARLTGKVESATPDAPQGLVSKRQRKLVDKGDE